MACGRPGAEGEGGDAARSVRSPTLAADGSVAWMAAPSIPIPAVGFYTPRKARFPPLLGLSARLARSWKPIDGFRVSKFFTLGERYR